MARKDEKVRLINIKKIVVDTDIQSRVNIDKQVSLEFSEAMLRGDPFPPVDIFHDPTSGDYILADGFHRIDAYSHIGKVDIRCVVHEGSRRDARIFSAGANRQFSAKRTVDDVRRSIRMLLEDDEWCIKNDSRIAEHVGCAGQTVKRVRIDFSREHNLQMPTEFENSAGNIRKSMRQFNVARRPPPDVAMKSSLPSRYTIEYDYIKTLLYRFGFVAVVQQGQGQKYPGIRTIRHERRKIVATTCDFAVHDSLPAAVGRVLIASRIVGGGDLVIVGYKHDGPSSTVAHAEELGIRFASPEELIAEMKKGE